MGNFPCPRPGAAEWSPRAPSEPAGVTRTQQSHAAWQSHWPHVAMLCLEHGCPWRVLYMPKHRQGSTDAEGKMDVD